MTARMVRLRGPRGIGAGAPLGWIVCSASGAKLDFRIFPDVQLSSPAMFRVRQATEFYLTWSFERKSRSVSRASRAVFRFGRRLQGLRQNRNVMARQRDLGPISG